MKLLIFATKKDYSATQILNEAKKRSIKCQMHFYSDLRFNNGKIVDKKSNVIKIFKNDRLILRSPYHPYISSLDYRFYAKKLLESYPDNILLDKDCYLKFPNYYDKLFQVNFFIKNKVCCPKTIHASKTRMIEKFPVIVKRRVSSRGKGNYVINSQKELNNFFQKRNPSDYLIQEYIDLKTDLRILILKNNILGAVERKIIHKSNNQIGVIADKKYTRLSTKVKKDALKIAKKLKADFVGIDLGISKSGKYYFIEINLAPQFSFFSKVTGINVAKKIIKLL